MIGFKSDPLMSEKCEGGIQKTLSEKVVLSVLIRSHTDVDKAPLHSIDLDITPCCLALAVSVFMIDEATAMHPN